MYCYRTVLKAHQTVASSCITTSLRHLNAAVQSKSAKNGKHHRHSSGKKVKEPFVDDYFVLKLFKDTDNECLKSIIGYSTFLPERHLGCFSFHTFRDIQNHLQVILYVKLNAQLFLLLSVKPTEGYCIHEPENNGSVLNEDNVHK